MSMISLQTRLQYSGGQIAEKRFQEDKLKGLKKALLYSYQAATAILEDGREFRCLINDDKTSEDYYDKILSIPYYDVCLNSARIGKTTQGEEEIGIKCGDIFEWKETGTHWLVYLEYLEEDAYFRAKIRMCDVEAEIGNHKYWIYLRGPIETTIQWNQKHNIVWNDINYSLIAYIVKNEETLDYFHRFTTLKIDGNYWEVKTVNPYYAQGIIKVCLGEWFNNEMQDNQIKPELPGAPPENEIYIEGPLRVKPYDIALYKIHNIEEENGQWSIDNRKARFLSADSTQAQIEIMSGKSGQFKLSYLLNDEVLYETDIIIESL